MPFKSNRLRSIDASSSLWLVGLLAALCVPAHATVSILSATPSAVAPQPIGASVNWTVTATDSGSGPLTFQFNVAPPGGALALVRDFNVGTLSSGVWTSQLFTWSPTLREGTYKVQVIIKDFGSGQTASLTVPYAVSPLVTGTTPVAVPTTNPLVALFSAPACAAGSHMRVVFRERSKATPATVTNSLSCHPPATMTFEIAGMYPNTIYTMFAQTITAGQAQDGPTVSFTTGALPATVPFPAFQTILAPQAAADTAAGVLVTTPLFLNEKNNYPGLATDLSGNILWYYYPSTSDHFELLTRPLVGTFLSIQNDTAWTTVTKDGQVLRQVDFAGNIVRETNTGIIQQQLLIMGATDGGPCSAISSPPPVGAGCLGFFHHDAIQTLPNGWTAVIADIEKIFPPGTQGNNTGLPVDIIGDIIIVLDTNWQVQWYFDAFQHDGGGTQLDINRPAVLGETCTNGNGCQPIFLLGPGIAPLANDWLHANSLYYDPVDGSIVWSSRHQDWVMKVDYSNGTGNGNLLWRMGNDGDFQFVNTYNDPWPWFSHQHDAGFQGNGTGAFTVFDNGDTRVSPPPLGVGSGDSRGMALSVNETSMQVSPILSTDVGVYCEALGSADLLSNGNYFFLAPFVPQPGNTEGSYAIEYVPNSGSEVGTEVYDLLGTNSYRAWRMASLYAPPIT